MIKPIGKLLVIAVVALGASAVPRVALAACHIADFREDAVTVDEDAGEVRLDIYLVGEQPTCAGEVRYETMDGTATAGADYEATSGQVRFTAGDDREETIVIPIVDDETAESSETFRVQLSQGDDPGTITPSNEPATVTIDDDDEAPSETPSEPEQPSPTETATTTDGDIAADTDDEGGGSAGIIAAIIAAVLALGAGAWWLARRGRNAPA